MDEKLEKKISQRFNQLFSDDILFPSRISADDPEISIISRFFGNVSGKKILDVGCGKGRFLKILRNKGAKIWGIDISSKMIVEAKKNVKDGSFAVGSVSNLPYPQNFFDCVLAIDVLEHVPGTERAISEMSRVLKTDGQLIIIDKNRLSLDPIYLIPSMFYKRIQEARGKWMYPSKFPFREKWFTFNQINKILKKHYRDIESQYIPVGYNRYSNKIYHLLPFLSYKVAWKSSHKIIGADLIIDSTVQWLEKSQYKRGPFNGLVPGTINQTRRVKPYPEITGYAASTFAKLYLGTSEKKYLRSAYDCSDAIIRLMSPNGAISGAISSQGFGKNLVYPFDQAMMARGLLDTYQASLVAKENRKKYLNKGFQAINYLIKIQNDDGSFFEKYHIDQQPMSNYKPHYLIKITCALLAIYNLNHNSLYFKRAKKLADWTIKNYLRSDGSFIANVDNDDRTHYHCYAIEGFLELANVSKKTRYYSVALNATNFLYNLQNKNGGFNFKISSSEKFEDVATAAQAMNLFLIFAKKTAEKKYFRAAQRAYDYLKKKQYISKNKNLNGGLPFNNQQKEPCVCSWASIFLIDAVGNWQKL